MEVVRFVVLLCVFVLHFTSGTRTNVARNKPTWMSSVFWSSPPASAAVDGVILAHEFNYSVVTNTLQTSAWWKVDLQTQVQSARVTLYFSTYSKSRRNGVQLYTSTTNSADPKEGNLCHSVTGRADGTDIPDVLSVTCPGTWRYPTLYTETDNDGTGALLEFVEVQVWTCTSGYYGSNCDQSCAARHCKSDSSCDVIGGLCVGGCAAGYQGKDCTQACGPGRYGEGCSKYCGRRRCKTPSDTCAHVTGICPDGSERGFMGNDCFQTCTSVMYGPNCASNCSSRHCKTPSSTCDRVTGQCPGGCEDGWTEIDCSKTCTSMMYGPNCASNCSSRHCKTPSSTCDRVTGQCPDGCEDGWTEIDCSRKCKPGTFGRDCSRCGHCDVTCNDGDGRCPGECLDGFTGDRCDVDVRVSPVTTGVIGGAIGVAVMLLIGGLMIWLLKSGRLKWIPTTTTDPQELRKTDTPNTGEISTHAPTSDVKDQDYTELNEFTREKNKSPYDVIQNETNQI